jgi:hypothetical protein
VQTKGKELSTFIFHGGYDSFVEEFYAFLLPLADLGFTVIGFDGPGQGGALRQGIYFEHAWEKPAEAVLDYFKLDAVTHHRCGSGGDGSIARRSDFFLSARYRNLPRRADLVSFVARSRR